jgi:hypothetical protein
MVLNRVSAKTASSGTVKTAISEAGGMCQEGYTLIDTEQSRGLIPVFRSIADSVGEFGRPYPTRASRPNRDTRVFPCGSSDSQDARRIKFIAAPVITC